MRAAPALLCAAFVALACAASAQAVSFACSASAGRIVVLGQVAEPVRSSGGATTCSTPAKSLTAGAAGLHALVGGSGVLAAGTETFPADRRVLASGGLADLKVQSLPGLPVTLPTAAVPAAARSAIAAARTVNVDLTGVKALIPVLPTNLPTNLATNLVTDLVALTLANPLLTVPQIQALSDANAATNLANATTNAVNLATNTANAATNAVRASIPDSVGVDGSAGLDALLAALLPDPELPNTTLLEAQSLIAYASGRCDGATPAAAGTATIAGLKVLGQAAPGTAEVDRTLTLIDAASIDPSAVALPSLGLGLTSQQLALIDGIPAAKAALDAALDGARATIRAALDALAAVPVLDAVAARVVVRPGVQTKEGATVVQEGLRAAVSIAGQTIFQAILGEARVAASGDCSEPLTAPGATTGSELGRGVVQVPGFSAEVDTRTPGGALLACSTRRLVLVDVLERAGRVRLSGVADPALAGRTAKIVFAATNRVVAHARIDEDGAFAASAPLPPASVRDTNLARYTAVLGDERSSNLKLQRRMVIESMTAEGRRVTITGRVLPPHARPLMPITLTRRVSCTQEKVEKRFRPDSDGSFSVTVIAPKGLGAAVYRLTTYVRYSATGTGTFKTYTLPRAVDLAS